MKRVLPCFVLIGILAGSAPFARAADKPADDKSSTAAKTAAAKSTAVDSLVLLEKAVAKDSSKVDGSTSSV